MTCSTSLGSQKFSSHILGFISLCNTSLCVQKKKKKTCFPFIKYVWFLTCMSLTQKKKKSGFCEHLHNLGKKNYYAQCPEIDHKWSNLRREIDIFFTEILTVTFCIFVCIFQDARMFIFFKGECKENEKGYVGPIERFDLNIIIMYEEFL